MSDTTRRIISLENTKVVKVPEVDNLIADALGIISMELVKLHTKVKKGSSLTAEEGRLLNGYIKSLTELSKENRERDKGNDLSNLSVEELLALLGKQMPKSE